MALSLTGAQFVWSRLKQATAGSNEAVQQQFKALKLYLATQAKNPQLQFCVIDGSVNSSDSGNTASQVLADSACRLYALYLKKNGTTATWFKGSDNATTAATDGTQVIAEHDANAVAGNEIVRIYVNGKSLASGLTVTEDTTATGSTLTLLANRFDGFAIIGAP